jgi:hypothetical protein
MDGGGNDEGDDEDSFVVPRKMGILRVVEYSSTVNGCFMSSLFSVAPYSLFFISLSLTFSLSLFLSLTAVLDLIDRIQAQREVFAKK